MIRARSRDFLLLLLVLAVIGSALAVVRTKHQNRGLVNRLEGLRNEHERLDMEWAQLQLEEATLAHNARIDHVAREQLQMVDPHDYRIVTAGKAAR